MDDTLNAEFPRFLWKVLSRQVEHGGNAGRDNNGYVAGSLIRSAFVEMMQAGLVQQEHNEPLVLVQALGTDILWDWGGMGLLKLRATRGDDLEAQWKVTAYGMEALKYESFGATPYDPEGYIRELQAKIGRPIDQTALHYLEESFRTFRSNCFLSTMVMLGGSSERLILLLCEEVFTRIKTERSISQVWTDVQREVLRLSEADKAELKSNVGDSWEERLESGFNIIRQSRNEAGHPSIMRPVTRLETTYRFLLFAPYVETVYGILKHFGK